MRSVAPRESAARRYRIEKYLTEGGMGAIYLGKKMGSGGFQKEVVLKQLLPEYTSRPEFRDLFFREAKISATLDHANIVHTFDLVESDQSLFIVMEYVRGADLRTILRRARQRQRELSPAAAIHIALEILNGLAYAHARRDQAGNSLNIIHRDVSPSNIICSVQGEAKLSDFGIAKASTHSSVFYRVRGKVGYMSPEQARSQPIDHRCDLYSLAVCLYESLSGERLFVGDLNTPADEIYGHVILPISQKRAGLPAALDEVMARALSTDINDRYQSASEFSDALRVVAHKTGLGFSAPELAAHLREILGSDPDRWLRDEGTPMMDAAKVPAQSVGLVGKEAASIGLVAEGSEDEPPPLVLSPTAVSGSKDFDLESMLDDEATRPGVRGRGPAALTSPEPGAPQMKRGEPPPVWTRSSGPVPIVTPPPARMTTSGRVAAPAAGSAASGRVAAPAAVSNSGRAVPPPVPPAGSGRAVPPPVPAASSGRTAAPPAAKVAPPPPAVPVRSTAAMRAATSAMRAAAAAPTPAVSSPLPPPPPVPLPGRTAPRMTQRGMSAVPPPLPSTARAVPPPPVSRPSAQLPVQAQPEFDEPTPPPPVEAPADYAPAYAEQAPAYGGGVPHAQTLLGFGGGGLPMGRPAPAAYSQQAAPAPYQAEPAPYQSAPVPRYQPEMMDFSGSATLPEKSSGPPRWLAIIAVVGSLAGGAVLAHRATEGQMAAIAAFDDSRQTPPRPTTLDEKSLPPRAPAVEPGQPAQAAEAPAVEALPPRDDPPPAAAAHPAKPAHARAAKRHGPAHRKPGRH